jgi:hypothetical protein
LIGGIAGALGGWWAGRAVSEAAETLAEDDVAYFRQHYESTPNRPADRSFDDVRGAYVIGHIASRNPDYASRPFEDVEMDLERGWVSHSGLYGSWASARPFAREGYQRARERRAQETLGDQLSPQRPDERRD